MEFFLSSCNKIVKTLKELLFLDFKNLNHLRITFNETKECIV